MEKSIGKAFQPLIDVDRFFFIIRSSLIIYVCVFLIRFPFVNYELWIHWTKMLISSHNFLWFWCYVFLLPADWLHNWVAAHRKLHHFLIQGEHLSAKSVVSYKYSFGFVHQFQFVHTINHIVDCNMRPKLNYCTMYLCATWNKFRPRTDVPIKNNKITCTVNNDQQQQKNQKCLVQLIIRAQCTQLALNSWLIAENSTMKKHHQRLM